MRERQNNPIHKDIDPEQNLGDLKAALEIFRNSVHAEAEKPDLFWKRQHSAILSRLNESRPISNSRSCFFWAPAAAAVLFCLFFFGKPGKAPTPDIAAGADQDLLVDIDRALSRKVPVAFAPVSFLDVPKWTNKSNETSTRH